MKIFNYNSNGVFIGASIADKDPENPENFLVPAMATTIEPPSANENEIVVFDGEKWNVIEMQQSKQLTDEEKLELWRSQASIKKVQAWLNLQAKGYLQTVIDKMGTLPITDPLRIVWEHSESYSRNDIRLIEFCADELGLTADEIDALFIVQ